MIGPARVMSVDGQNRNHKATYMRTRDSTCFFPHELPSHATRPHRCKRAVFHHRYCAWDVVLQRTPSLAGGCVNVDVLFPSDLEAKIAKAIEEKDMAAIYASGITEMETDDFEPDFEVLSLDIRGITFYPRDDFSRIGFSVEQGHISKTCRSLCNLGCESGDVSSSKTGHRSVMRGFASVSITRLKMEMEPGVQVENLEQMLMATFSFISTKKMTLQTTHFRWSPKELEGNGWTCAS